MRPVTVAGVVPVPPPRLYDRSYGGAEGATTVTAIVAGAIWPVESATTYFIVVAGPVNVGSGLNVTIPVCGSTVYSPSFGTTNDLEVQLPSGVPTAHKPMELGLRNAPAPAESPSKTLMI